MNGKNRQEHRIDETCSTNIDPSCLWSTSIVLRKQAWVNKGLHSTMASLFQNARQAQHYAAARPTYPKALFQKIYEATIKIGNNDTNQSSAVDKSGWYAADFGCGTGQATVALAEYFASVTGIDPSPSQIAQATPHERVRYVTGTSSDPNLLQPQSMACITAAQAAHWFDLPKFYSVVNDALRPGGVLALIVYGNAKFPNDPVLEHKIMVDLYEHALADHWDPRRRIVEYLYRDLETIDQYYAQFETEILPRDDQVTEHKAIEKIQAEMTHDELLGYLRSWSGYTRYIEATPGYVENTSTDPLYDLVQYLHNKPKVQVVFPLRLILSTKKI